ncbi:Prevent-host-death family protein [Acidithiobacillus ferrivorans]|jgi:prevent-host-death family protein|uniref:Antitoxin n=1 Tax=Acidithiobacillus ferrivorans TaxID=160808 RepID=A0A060UU65_9PROT|nr:type II toxin-antitoxin system Phd/YefM family antitoxin [Acidithiobacillus ferrivorans]MBU2768741.1 type II toxin-antitoxin system Phd/YefM family antitoxin [Acidithiobacillus ferrivorans]MBU2850458.1 type II toxin-antitoxin system Phd/YefM family antitoxin [Acidithiobacillus ferrivorans]OCB01883.1 hypothetical protein BBC27_01565 [Acidithiobacillus ferrivorans]CDQ11871.1 Prevent-host-death family protein [Acidithiobacillus ferrivorans]SMH65426.1 Prevent-host-death family protein [Acidithi
MNTQWPLQEARNHLSDVVKRARNDGPQTITLHGEPAVVVLSVEQFRTLTRPNQTLSEFFADSPLRGLDLEVERDHHDVGRDVSL